MSWKLGDTSWRVTNQIGLYTDLLFYLYDNEEGVTGNDIFKWAFNKGIKKKREDESFTHVNFLTNTLKNLGLIKKSKSLSKLSTAGKQFIDVLNDKWWEKTKYSLFFSFKWEQLCWLSLMVGWSPFKNEFKPFLEIIKHAVNNGDVQDEFLIEIISKSKSKISNEERKFEKKISGHELFKSFNESRKNNEIIKMCDFLNQIFSLKPNLKLRQCFSEFIKTFESNKGIKVIKTRANNVDWSKTKKINEISDIAKIFGTYSVEEYNFIFNKISNEITAKKEYLNLNKYWLNNLNIFDNDGLCLSLDNNNFLFFEEFLKISNEVSDDSKIFILKEKFSDIFNKIEPKLEFAREKRLPFNKEQAIRYLELSMNSNVKDLDDFIKNNDIPQPVSKPSLFEYFSNLKIYFFLKENGYNPKISGIQTILDSNLMPIWHASGGKPDGIFELENLNVVIEATTITDKNSIIIKEEESILRHVWDAWRKNGKKTILFFFSPDLPKRFEINNLFNFTVKPYPIDNNLRLPKNRISIRMIWNDNLREEDFYTLEFDKLQLTNNIKLEQYLKESS